MSLIRIPGDTNTAFAEGDFEFFLILPDSLTGPGSDLLDFEENGVDDLLLDPEELPKALALPLVKDFETLLFNEAVGDFFDTVFDFADEPTLLLVVDALFAVVFFFAEFLLLTVDVFLETGFDLLVVFLTTVFPLEELDFAEDFFREVFLLTLLVVLFVDLVAMCFFGF